MATTSLWRIHGNVNRVVKYVMNPDKTEQQILVTGLSCSTENAAEDMNRVKMHFGKMDGVTAYHGYQSFSEGEVTPQKAHEIGVELAQRLWGDRYQVVITTHTDKENHIHNHFVLNTVSFVNGIKYHRTEADYRNLRSASDLICRENDLSIVDYPENGKGISHGEWNAERSGRITMRGMIRADIDAAVRASFTMQKLMKTFHDMGYELKLYDQNGRMLRRPSLKPPGAERFFRFDRLGKGYNYHEIEERVLNHSRIIPIINGDEWQKIKQYRDQPHAKYSGITALYYHFCYELNIIKEQPHAIPGVSAFMREELKKLDRLDEQVRFLAKNDIHDDQKLCAFRSDLQEQYDAENARREKLRNMLRAARTAGREDKTPGLKDEVTSLTASLKKTKNEISLCTEIHERCHKVSEALTDICSQYEETEKANMRQKKRKEMVR